MRQLSAKHSKSGRVTTTDDNHSTLCKPRLYCLKQFPMSLHCRFPTAISLALSPKKSSKHLVSKNVHLRKVQLRKEADKKPAMHCHSSQVIF